MRPDKTNIISKFYLPRFNRKRNIVKFVHVKINDIFIIFYKKFNRIISTPSDQNWMIYDSFDSSQHAAYN